MADIEQLIWTGSRMPRRIIIALTLCLAGAYPAHAADWYEISGDKTECVDVTANQTLGGNPKLATPQGTAELYQSLGDLVTTRTVHDAAGADIVMVHITDDDGNPFLNVTFFPSLADCQFVLNYSQTH